MPELPEVETTRRGIAPYIEGKTVQDVVLRQRRLRWPVPARLQSALPGQVVISVGRRGKYLFLCTAVGTVVIHLGMSGSLRLVGHDEPAGKHDHVDIVFAGDIVLRMRDPRRFGAVLWTSRPPLQHKLLAALGPEPLGEAFDAEYLYRRSRGRRLAIKPFIMDSKIVVGVGNIYASEALFRAGIRPGMAAGRLSRPRCACLVSAIREVLAEAIEAGGTTLRDFVSGEGRPGYFQQALQVYGRGGEPCEVCATAIRQVMQGQRATYYCPQCQR